MSKTAILFPGQGAQYFSLGKDFYETETEYQNTISQVSQIIPELKEVIYEIDDDRLNDTLYTQFAISSMELGIYNVIKDRINIDAVAGFSLGEYAALSVSGVFNQEDIFQIINLRTQAMNAANPDGAMIAILRVGYDDVVKHLDNLKNELNIDAYIANYNSPEQIVVSCKNDVLEETINYLKDQGIRKVVALKVSGPFHSLYYQDAAQEFSNNLREYKTENPQIDLYLNTSGSKYDNEDIYEVCEQQMYTQVNWYPLIKQMIADGVTNFIEVGPGQVLSGLMKKIDKNVTIINIEKITDLEKLEDL